MKRKRIVLFLLGFLAGYLFLCYGPGMEIKLEAPPMEYFLENLSHNFAFKAAVGGALGLALALIPGHARRKKGTKVTK